MASRHSASESPGLIHLTSGRILRAYAA